MGIVLLAVLAGGTAGEEAPERAATSPGLLAEYSGPASSAWRIDPDVTFDWGEGSPDPRIQAGPFRVRWTGQLAVGRPGRYRFGIHLAGRASLRLDHHVVIEGSHDSPGWLLSEPIDLAYGHHAIEVEYEKTGATGRAGLYWEPKGLDFEPVGPDRFLHASSGEAVGLAELSARGEDLVHAHRCTACHAIPVFGMDVRGPSLARLNGSVRTAWLVDHLRRPSTKGPHAGMPDFGLDGSEAEAVAAFLVAASPKPASSRAPAKGKPETGQELVQRLGCLACHALGDEGSDSLFGGGDLAAIAAKRPDAFFAGWLTKPEVLNPHHRMPRFDLAPQEVRDLSAYLATLGKPAHDASALPSADDAKARGRRIVEAKRCTQCHEIPGLAAGDRLPWRSSALADLAAGSACTGEPVPAKHQPGYRLNRDDREAIAAFLGSLPSVPAVLSQEVRGRWVLTRNGCLGCHARGQDEGLRKVVGRLGITDRKAQAALVPPALDAVGDKMHREWLEKAVAGTAPRLRPWLGPRMPRFSHSPDDIQAVSLHFIGHDRIPEPAIPSTEPPDRSAVLLAAHRLVGGAGFGCMSCHTIGRYEPARVEPGARGSDLRLVGQRMRRSWFLRWTRDPVRISAEVEMPAIRLAVPGVLDGRVRTQVEALWEGLNAPQFDLPTAGAVQLLRPDESGRAVILRDLFEHSDGAHTVRPLAVGLAHGHNLLLDLDEFAIRRWWVGDCARQKTRGKTWYWESAGMTVLDFAKRQPMIALRKDGKMLGFPSTGSPVGRLTAFGHSATGGAWLRYRLVPLEGVELEVEMAVERQADPAGLVIHFAIEGVPHGCEPVYVQPACQPAEPAEPGPPSAVRGGLAYSTAVGPAAVTLADGSERFSEPLGEPGARTAVLGYDPATERWKTSVHLECQAVLPPQPAPSSSSPPREARVLPVLPGYEVVRLPVPEGPMPTSIAFGLQGAMYVASLKGGVYRALDQDGDGLADAYQIMSDHLAAPYGLLADGSDLLVSHKHELLRLEDRDGDGRAERSQVVASGWGVTVDYHDWAVGLVRDPQGRLYISPSSQQDERPALAAMGRGKVLQIDPASGQPPRLFAEGIRFAMGLAFDSSGELFATDNQGMTNPFNELNHIRPGRHYGFWNALEPRRPGQEVTAPAIQIPHPWSRSVNGIVFVPTDGSFGPFAGHLIGADYTARKLIRMTLQRIGDAYQGCAYPFSNEEPELVEQDQTFLGPVALAYGPDGALYVGSMIDSGWGGGDNRGTIERVRFVGGLPFGIREVRAHAAGFEIDFIGPADPHRAADPKQYSLSCYRRIHKGGYATPDQDRTTVSVERVTVANDRQSVRLVVRPMKPGFVYDIGIGRVHEQQAPPHPALAFYTLNQVPADDR